jgi:predicted nucleotidyltransferase
MKKRRNASLLSHRASPMTVDTSLTNSDDASLRLHLDDESLAIVQRILAEHLPGREVWAFGSRVHGRHLKPFSDLDLAIVDETRLSPEVRANLQSAFAESDLRFRVDIVELIDADDDFRRQIEDGCRRISKGV